MDKIFRPTYAEVDLSILRKTFRKIVELAGMPVMPMVKATAHSHGFNEVAISLVEVGS